MSSPSDVKHGETQQHVKTRHVPLSQSPEEIRLDTAIEEASRPQLCQILRQLCAHSKTATEMTMSHLARDHEKAEAPKQATLRSILKKPGSFKPNLQSTPGGPTSASNETSPSSQMQSKRKATTQCRNCGFEYNPVNTDPLACTYHPGKREVNPEHEVWDDFDPDVLGDAWTLMEYDEFASGFQWSCCKTDIDKRGCMLGKHQAAPVGEWKRARQ
ncbi:hypothetical protein MBLNU13_g04722t1 [Cladosporium sp. NU13]